MAKRDAAGRLLRFERPRSILKTKDYPRDIDWYEFIARIGGHAPTPYIHAHTAEHYTDPQSTEKRLRQLWRAWKLTRNSVQAGTYDPRMNFLVHELDPTSIQLLKRKGRWSEYYPRASGSYFHQVMCDCVRGSVELEARVLGIPYFAEHSILEHANKMNPNRKKIHLFFDLKAQFGHDLRPDGMFMITDGDTNVLFFIECDRGTTQRVASGAPRKTIELMFEQYRHLFNYKIPQHLFSLDATCKLLNITVYDGRMENMIDMTDDADILHLCLPRFSKENFNPALLTLLTTEWHRSNRPPWIIVRT
jgi:hypothetical protein